MSEPNNNWRGIAAQHINDNLDKIAAREAEADRIDRQTGWIVVAVGKGVCLGLAVILVIRLIGALG